MIIPKIRIPRAMLSDSGMNNVFRYVLKSIKAIENVPNVLKAIRLFNSLLNASKCKTSFNNTKKISVDPIIKNIPLWSVYILPNDKIAKISPVIAKGRFFIIFIIIV